MATLDIFLKKIYFTLYTGGFFCRHLVKFGQRKTVVPRQVQHFTLRMIYILLWRLHARKWNIPEDSLFSFTTFRSLKEFFFKKNFSISKNHIIWGLKLHPCQGSMKFEQVLFQLLTSPWAKRYKNYNHSNKNLAVGRIVFQDFFPSFLDQNWGIFPPFFLCHKI